MKKKQTEKEKFIARKMRIMADENRPRDQKIAIALSEARRKGL